MKSNLIGQKGFTLVETLVSIALMALVLVSVYTLYTQVVNITSIARQRIIAANLANEQFEIIRNLSYGDIGTVGGVPSGLLPQAKTETREGIDFTITTTVRNIDDPFDGTIGGTPNDNSPADNKLVQISVQCASCTENRSFDFVSRIAPRGLETSDGNGALIVRVLDASGQPVVGADVTVVNTGVDPQIDLVDVTNSRGELAVIDTAPDVEGYEVSVSKTGYTTQQTYAVGGSGNPDPHKPHATVSEADATLISFVIDEISDIQVSTVDQLCVPQPNIDFDLVGSKTIGDPNVLNYSASHTTDGSGLAEITGLEWDAYTLTVTESGQDIVGYNPSNAISLDPGVSQNIQVVTQSSNPGSVTVFAYDTTTGEALSDVRIILTDADDNQITRLSSRGITRQSDWSGGSGVATFTPDSDDYWSEVNIDGSTMAGDIILNEALGSFYSNGNLESSTFDLGGPVQFHDLFWEPQDQPSETGPDSVRFQLASNTDNLTWNFVGPDGTNGSFYTVNSQTIHASHDNDQYFRYKVYLSTEDINFSPNLAEFAFSYTSTCSPPGYVIFDGLNSGEYDIDARLNGYLDESMSIEIDSDWQMIKIPMTVVD